jgi:excisionase family DNA binding protein
MEHKIMRDRKMTGKNRRKLSSDRLTLRPKETTALTGLSVGATYDLLESGAMPSIKIGKKYLIPREALIDWINSCGKAHVTPAAKLE